MGKKKHVLPETVVVDVPAKPVSSRKIGRKEKEESSGRREGYD